MNLCLWGTRKLGLILANLEHPIARHIFQNLPRTARPKNFQSINAFGRAQPEMESQVVLR